MNATKQKLPLLDISAYHGARPTKRCHPLEKLKHCDLYLVVWKIVMFCSIFDRLLLHLAILLPNWLLQFDGA